VVDDLEQRRAIVRGERLLAKTCDGISQDGEGISDLVRNDGGELAHGRELLLGGERGLGGAQLVVRVHEFARTAAELAPSSIESLSNLDVFERELCHEARHEHQQAEGDEVKKPCRARLEKPVVHDRHEQDPRAEQGPPDLSPTVEVGAGERDREKDRGKSASSVR
jgi:hypothetical protein